MGRGRARCISGQGGRQPGRTRRDLWRLQGRARLHRVLLVLGDQGLRRPLSYSTSSSRSKPVCCAWPSCARPPSCQSTGSQPLRPCPPPALHAAPTGLRERDATRCTAFRS